MHKYLAFVIVDNCHMKLRYNREYYIVCLNIKYLIILRSLEAYFTEYVKKNKNTSLLFIMIYELVFLKIIRNMPLMDKRKLYITHK